MTTPKQAADIVHDIYVARGLGSLSMQNDLERFLLVDRQHANETDWITAYERQQRMRR